MPKTETVLPATIDSLLGKSDTLTKHGEVWTYPGAAVDLSGTNLKLPLEYVPHGLVIDALSKGDLVAKAMDPTGAPTVVGRPSDDGRPVRIMSLATAGSVEASTELPLNSRPTHDAGAKPLPTAGYVPAVKAEPAKPLPPAAPAPAAAPVQAASTSK